MKKLYSILLIFAVFYSCNRVIDSKKMENLLYDIHVAEAVMDVKRVPSAKEMRRSHYDYIFEKHKITRKQFEKSIKWYAANPKKMEAMYENVKKRIEKLQVDVENYVYHPEEKVLEANRMLDTVQIFKFEKQYNFKNSPSKDTLAFEIADRDYFALADRFILRFLIQVECFDEDKQTSLPNTKSFLTITYSNGAQKTMTGTIPTNNKYYRYTFQMPVNDSIIPVKIHGNLFEGKDMIRSLRIDSAELIRIYNAEKYPLSDSMKTVLGVTDKPKELPEMELIERIDIKHSEFQNVRHSTLQRKLDNSQLIKKEK